MLPQIIPIVSSFARSVPGSVRKQAVFSRMRLLPVCCFGFLFTGLPFVVAQSTIPGGYPVVLPQRQDVNVRRPVTPSDTPSVAPGAPSGLLPNVVQNDHARLPLPRTVDGASAGFHPQVAEYAPRYGETRTVAPPKEIVQTGRTAPAAKPVGRESEKKTEIEAKPLNPFDYIDVDFNGMFQAVKSSSKKAADSTKKWFLKNFEKCSADDFRDEEEGVLDGFFRKTAPGDEPVANPFLGVLHDAVNEERAGNYAAAEAGYSRFIQDFRQHQLPNRPSRQAAPLAHAHHRLAVVFWKQGKTAAADSHFRYAVDLSRQRANVALASDYALFLEGVGRHDQGEILLRNALVDEPNNARLERLLGRSLAHQNRPVESLRHLNAVMDEPSAYRELAGIYRQRGDERAALLAESRAKSSNATVDPSHMAGGYGMPRSMTAVTGAADVRTNTAPPRPAATPGGSDPASRVYHYSSGTASQTYHYIPSGRGDATPASYTVQQ